MMLKILFSARPGLWQDYKDILPQALSDSGLSADLNTEFPPEDVDYIVFAPNGHVVDFSPFRKAKAALSLWAGVEDILKNPTLNLPLTRMVDPGLAEGMREWVCAHVFRHHLGIDRDIQNPEHSWTPRVPPLARQRRIGILGAGQLGTACGIALNQLGFDVRLWARTPKPDLDIECWTGADGLEKVLRWSQILVLLLPLTVSTENILNAETMALLPKGAVVLNPGRGALIKDADLLEALDAGQISAATLDVFRSEPLPQDHPFWSHPAITVTPHIASATRPETASVVLAENIQLNEKGLPMRFLVDRRTGY